MAPPRGPGHPSSSPARYSDTPSEEHKAGDETPAGEVDDEASRLIREDRGHISPDLIPGIRPGLFVLQDDRVGDGRDDADERGATGNRDRVVSTRERQSQMLPR